MARLVVWLGFAAVAGAVAFGPSATRAQPGLAELLEKEEAGRPAGSPPAGVDVPSAPQKEIPDGRTRTAIPSADRLRAAMKALQEVYGDEVGKAQSPEAKSRLAVDMVTAAEVEPDLVNRYALLEMGRRVAVDAGDIDNARKAVDLLAGEFAIDGADALQQTLSGVAAKATGDRASRVVEVLLGIAMEKARGDGAGDAESLVKAAQAAARKSGRKADIERAQRALAEIRSFAKARGRAVQLREKLKENPDDQKARAELAVQLCTVDDDWAGGLTLLTKSDDPQLVRLATGDLASPKEQAALMALADGWWSYAEGVKGDIAGLATARAVHHYHSVIGELRGLDRTKVEKRIAAAAAKRPGGGAAANRPRNLIAHFDASAPAALLGPDNRPIPEFPRSPMPVSAWLDPENMSAAAKQSAPAARPVAVIHEASGLRALRFNASQYLVSAQPVTDVGTLIMVIDPTHPLAPACFVGKVGGKSGIDIWTRAGGEGMFRMVDAPGNPFHISTAAGVMSRPGPQVVTVQWFEPMVLRINGKLVSDQQKMPAMDRGTSKGIVFGASADAVANPYSGLLCECLLFDVQLPPDAMLQIERTLAAKWKAGGVQ